MAGCRYGLANVLSTIVRALTWSDGTALVRKQSEYAQKDTIALPLVMCTRLPSRASSSKSVISIVGLAGVSA